MVKKRLMLGAAFAALGLIPLTTGTASAQQNGELLGQYDLDIRADWDNDVDVELDWDVDVSKELDIFGTIVIDGSITADALSQATLDDKQFLTGNSVDFEDYQNANQDGGTLAEPGPGQGTGDPLFTEEGAASGPAIYSNSVVSTSAADAASGNVGINLAAGDYNLQENAAVISNADGVFPAETEVTTTSTSFSSSFATSTTVQTGTAAPVTTTSSFNITSAFTTTTSSFRSARTSGAAEAGSFSLQTLFDNSFNGRYELENSDVDNTVDVGGALTAADGNLGLNAAAGAFNIQKNALVIASITGGHLAEATSGVIQHSEANSSVIENVTNAVTFTSSLTNATGNIGVNLAAGVGNLQLNSLTIANALAGAPVDTGTGPGDTGTGPGGPTNTGPTD